MASEANSITIAPYEQPIRLAEPPPPRRRPDPEMLWALCKGVSSTLITIVTLSAVIFVCSHVEPRSTHERTAGVARHD